MPPPSPRRPSPKRTDPCGSMSTSSVRIPRRASAAARLIAVVVLPTPPFWLTTAIVPRTLCFWVRWYVGAAGAQRGQRALRVTHPALHLRSRRRLGEKGVEMRDRAVTILPLQEKKG